MKTEIAKDMERAGNLIRYDAQCKKVLSNTYILAWITKTVIQEYEGLSIEAIRQCIENEPQVGQVPVDPGKWTKEKIEGLRTEDKDAEEGAITYDILFKAYVPEGIGWEKILVDIEAQQNFNPGYAIPARGNYYGSRLISSQKGTEFTGSEYDNIKKVYSIWICLDAPKYVGNAISIYQTEKVDLFGSIPAQEKSYKKMFVVMICLNEKVPREKGFFDMMNTLLSPTLNIETKKAILEKEYQIPMENKYAKEVESMGGFSQWVLGMGIEQGIEQEKRSIVRNLLKEGVSNELILKVTEMSEEQLEEIKKEVLCAV